VLGLEILKLISPKVEKKAIKSYLDLKNKAIEVVKDW
jgi:hypothetical protein